MVSPNWMVYSMVEEMLFLLPFACSSEMTGSSMADMEAGTALGNIRKDSAIPVRMPYILKASAVVRPDFCRLKGISTASALCRRVRLNRLPVRGRAIRRRERHLSRSFRGRIRTFCSPPVTVSMKRALPASPASRPKTARAGVMVSPCWILMLQRSHTVPMRRICSRSCAAAGIPVFFRPR